MFKNIKKLEKTFKMSLMCYNLIDNMGRLGREIIEKL